MSTLVPTGSPPDTSPRRTGAADPSPTPGTTPPSPLTPLVTGALVVLAVVAPWAPGLVLPLSLAVVVLWLLLVVDTRRQPLPPLLVVAAGIPLAQVVSLPTAVDPARSLVLTGVSALGWGTAAALVHLGPRERRLVLGAVLVSLVAVSAQSLTGLGELSSSSGGAVVSGRLQGPFAQPNELGAYTMLGLPLLLAAASTARRPGSRAVLLVAAVPVLCALALSLSRGSWVGAVAGLLVLVLLLPPARGPVAGGVGAVVLVLAGLMLLGADGPGGVLIERIGSLSDPSASPDDHRPLIWAMAASAAAASPVVGVGPGGLEQIGSGPDSPLVAEPPLHAHNLPLTVLAETGALGLVVLLALLAVLLRLVLLGTSGRGPGWEQAGARWVAAGATAALCGAGIQGVIDFPWRNPIITATTWLLAGAVAALPLTRVRDAASGTLPVVTRSRSTSAERTDMKILPSRADRATEAPAEIGHASGTPADAEPRPDRSHPERTRNDQSAESSGDPGAGSADGGATATGSAGGAPAARRRRAWLLPAILAVLGAVAVTVGVAQLPTQQQADAVVGLRSEGVSQEQVPTSSDELRLIAQQYAVALAADTQVEAAVAELGLGEDAGATAEVDPDSTTVRISATADDAAQASRLADRLVDLAADRAEDDPQVAVVQLSEPSPDHTTTTPSRPLYLAAGYAVVLVCAVGLWLLRRSAR